MATILLLYPHTLGTFDFLASFTLSLEAKWCENGMMKNFDISDIECPFPTGQKDPASGNYIAFLPTCIGYILFFACLHSRFRSKWDPSSHFPGTSSSQLGQLNKKSCLHKLDRNVVSFNLSSFTSIIFTISYFC